MSRVIVHLDADAFYASVEQAADSRLRGKPIAVGGEKRGIIASASYEARKFGVFTPMPTVRARKLCPKLIVVPGDYERYEKFSRQMFSYAQDFTPDVEITSIDEGYFDVTAVRKTPIDVAQIVREAIRQSLKISVSEGIGASKLVSQIASKLTKPAAFNEVPPGKEISFLHPLPNKWLPGIGPHTAQRLNAAGLAFIRQIAAMPVDMLGLLVGKQATQLQLFANGVDERLVMPSGEPAKSYGQQQTFGTDITDEEYVEAILRRMADDLMAKVRADGKSVRTLTVKVRYNDMEEDQCGESLREPTDLETDMYGRLRILLRKAWQRRVSLRLVSLKLSSVHGGVFRTELALEARGKRHEAQHRLATIVDELRRTHGREILLRGHDFRLRDPARDAAALLLQTPTRVIRASGRTVPKNYTPLRVQSHYSFLDSMLSPTEVVELAKQHGMPAVALTDAGNLHGAVEFVQAAKQAGIKPILGAELRLGESLLLLYVESTRGYHSLCRLLSRHAEREAAGSDEASVVAKQRHPYHRNELDGLTDGLIAVSDNTLLADLFPQRFYRLVTSRDTPDDHPAVACPAVHYAIPSDRRKFDILQSIRTLTLLPEGHPEKRCGGRFHFRTPAEMTAACREHPDWMRHSLEIAERCNFEFPFGKPQFPDFQPPDGSAPRAFLRRLVTEGLRRRYRESASQFAAQVEEELGIIAAVGYEGYFLITWELLQECRAHGIEWITRGSAADSLVCYCLGISDVCPIRFDLYFKRFLNPERMALHKLPDIDVDFPHDRKDDVVRLIFAK